MDFEKEKKIAIKNGFLDKLYPNRVTYYIRQEYTIDDELAIQRQRDDKPEEFEAYNAYVEECKAKAYRDVYDSDREV